MVYLFIFLGLILAIIGLSIANVIVKKKLKNKHSEKGENN
jgi:hypothetical protein